MCDFIGVCDDEACQREVSDTATYRQILAGSTRNASKHYISLEWVPARELEVGDRVIVLDDFGDAHLLAPCEKLPPSRMSAYIMSSDLVDTVRVADDVMAVTLRRYGQMRANSHSPVLRSQLPNFRMLSALQMD